MDINQQGKATENSSSDYLVRVATSADANAICELFRKVFKEEMSLVHWQWKYERELGKAIVVYKGDQLVAHYGGVGTKILLEGKESTAIQVTDLMVDPLVRNTVRSKSPFYLSAKQFLENYAGFENPFLLAYGFPSERAMKLSEKLGLFTPVGSMWEAQWATSSNEKKMPENIITLDKNNFPDFEQKINSLWKKFAGHFLNHIICKKDAEYFRWRFLEHPTNKYSIHIVLGRYIKLPRSVFVLKHDNKKSMLMDVLGRSMDLKDIVELAKAVTIQQDNRVLVTWHSDSFNETYNLLSAEQKPLTIKIPANICSKGPAPETQKNKWWFTPGDTDYL